MLKTCPVNEFLVSSIILLVSLLAWQSAQRGLLQSVGRIAPFFCLCLGGSLSVYLASPLLSHSLLWVFVFLGVGLCGGLFFGFSVYRLLNDWDQKLVNNAMTEQRKSVALVLNRWLAAPLSIFISLLSLFSISLLSSVVCIAYAHQVYDDNSSHKIEVSSMGGIEDKDECDQKDKHHQAFIAFGQICFDLASLTQEQVLCHVPVVDTYSTEMQALVSLANAPKKDLRVLVHETEMLELLELETMQDAFKNEEYIGLIESFWSGDMSVIDSIWRHEASTQIWSDPIIRAKAIGYRPSLLLQQLRIIQEMSNE